MAMKILDLADNPSHQNTQSQVNIYCDESGIGGNDRYLLFGSLFCPEEKEKEVQNLIKRYREEQNLSKEMKWEKISKRYLAKYRGYIGIFFDSPWMQYNCIVIDKHHVLYAERFKRDPKLAFIHFLHLLLTRNMNYGTKYRVFLDEGMIGGSYTYSNIFKRNNEWVEQRPNLSLFESLCSIDSSEHDLVQITDILSGAIRSRFERRFSSDIPRDFSNFVANRGGLGSSTIRYPRKLNVWCWSPEKQSMEHKHSHQDANSWHGEIIFGAQTKKAA